MLRSFFRPLFLMKAKKPSALQWAWSMGFERWHWRPVCSWHGLKGIFGRKRWPLVSALFTSFTYHYHGRQLKWSDKTGSHYCQITLFINPIICYLFSFYPILLYPLSITLFLVAYSFPLFYRNLRWNMKLVSFYIFFTAFVHSLAG